MKRLFFLSFIFFSVYSFSQPVVYSGTFLLDLSQYSGNISNVEFVRGTQSYPMVSIGNNQYSYNFISPPTMSPTIYYKFSINGVVESFSSSDSCLFTNPVTNDILRYINLSTDTPSFVCWESCSPCSPSILGCTDSTAVNFDPSANIDNDSCEYTISFFLDMSEANLIYDTLELNGTFNNWCGNCAQMTHLNNDIWAINIILPVGTYEYKFSADNWNIQENLFEFDDCVVGSPPYINRSLTVTGNQVLDTICWNRCYSCETERNFYNVTFQLDMSNAPSTFVIPEVNGTFNNWCGNCWTLNSAGNNIFSASFNVDTSLHTFKFSADNWSMQEELDSNLSCILINYDPASPNGWGYVNRYLRSDRDTILATVCWEDCIDCLPQPAKSWDCDGQGNCYDPGNGLGVYNDSLNCVLACQVNSVSEHTHDMDIILFPNPTKESIFIEGLENVKMIHVYNKLGETIFRMKNLTTEGIEINLLDNLPGLYFIELHSCQEIVTKKIIKL